MPRNNSGRSHLGNGAVSEWVGRLGSEGFWVGDWERARALVTPHRRQSAPQGSMHFRSWLGSSPDPAGYAGYAVVWRQHEQQATLTQS